MFLITTFFPGKNFKPKWLHHTRKAFRCKYCWRYRAGISHYLSHLRRHESNIKPYWYKDRNLPPKAGGKRTLRHLFRIHATKMRKHGKSEKGRRHNSADDPELHLSKRKENFMNVAKKAINRDTHAQPASTGRSVVKDESEDEYNIVTQKGSSTCLHEEKEISFVSGKPQYFSKELFMGSHKETQEMRDNEQWTCEHWNCEESFPKSQSVNIQLHEIEHWRDIFKRAQNLMPSEKALEHHLNSGGSSHCKICDCNCDSPEMLRIHRLCYEKRWKCIHCFRSFEKLQPETEQVCTHRDGGQKHQVFMKNHLYNCSHCEMSFTTQACLQGHYVEEKCELCGMSVNCLYERQKHVKMCSFCNNSRVITSAKQKNDAILLLHRIY